MPTSCVPKHYCGTHAPGWLSGAHPTSVGQIVNSKVCFHWGGSCCNWHTYIQIKKCNGFYVYKLGKTPCCWLRYCGNAGFGELRSNALGILLNTDFTMQWYEHYGGCLLIYCYCLCIKFFFANTSNFDTFAFEKQLKKSYCISLLICFIWNIKWLRLRIDCKTVRIFARVLRKKCATEKIWSECGYVEWDWGETNRQLVPTQERRKSRYFSVHLLKKNYI